VRILYKPFAIVAGLIAARLGRSAFKTMWAKIDPGDPPNPKAEEASMGKVVGAAALEAATMAGVAAAAERASARTFHYLTGFWPAKKEKKPADDEQA
jgi:hypothetical protein